MSRIGAQAPLAGHKIAYVMSRFPHLPETFILREMAELERQGWQVALYPLILQDPPLVHAEAKPWLARARPLPYIATAVLAENWREFLRQPCRYLATWREVLWENRTSPGFLIRAVALFPKAVYAATLMQGEGVSHVHAHYATHPALAAWIIHRLTGISYSVTVHAHDIFVCRAMLATKLREAAWVVAISDFNREYLARVIGPWIRSKTHVVHCGIEPEKYVSGASALPTGGVFELISVGSLQPYKGFPHLIEACALLRERGIPLRCRIVGGGEDRPLLEQMIAQARLEGSIELLGSLPQAAVAPLLATADCYVQPSIITPAGKMEGIPVSLMEALACALPVVASDISGIPELVRHRQTGLLVPPANASALADALATIYDRPQLAATLGRAGQEHVWREFDLKSNVSRLATLFGGTRRTRPLPPLAEMWALPY
jgi:colanic acid/amylovoran biosynthesis glycosyltransferase